MFGRKGTFGTLDEMTREAMLPELNLGLPSAELFSTQEADRLLTDLAEDTNDIMFENGLVIRI